jgi:xanthine/uracil permease
MTAISAILGAICLTIFGWIIFVAFQILIKKSVQPSKMERELAALILLARDGRE